MQRLIFRLAANALALFVAISALQKYFPTGIRVDQLGAVAFIGLAVVFTLVNGFVRPILKLLSCPLIPLTLGLFTLVINGVVFWLTGVVGTWFDIGFQVDPWPAFLGGLVVGLVNAALTLVLRDELKPS